MFAHYVYLTDKIMATDSPSNLPSNSADAEALVSQFREKGLLSIEFLERQVAEMQGETGERARAAADVEGKKELSPEQQRALLLTLQGRFAVNKKLHQKIEWAAVKKSLQAASPEILFGLHKMEETGGEPDVFMDEQDSFVFGDCSAESPSGRRNVVFDKAAEEGVRKGSFNGNAVDMASEMGVDLMDENQYRALQKLLPVDARTWSWLKTPADVRESGNALNGNRDGSSVNVNKNNPNNHNDNRAFRAALRVYWLCEALSQEIEQAKHPQKH